jgi:hypothetical protein
MERKGHVAATLLMATVGVGLAGLISNPIIVMALLCFAQIGIHASDVLAAAGQFPHRCIGRRWHRRDQFASKSFRLCRPLCDGLPEEFDRQLHGQPSVAGRLRIECPQPSSDRGPAAVPTKTSFRSF